MSDEALRSIVSRVCARPKYGWDLSGWPGCVLLLTDMLRIGQGKPLTPEFWDAVPRLRGMWDARDK